MPSARLDNKEKQKPALDICLRAQKLAHTPSTKRTPNQILYIQRYNFNAIFFAIPHTDGIVWSSVYVELS